MLAIKLYLPQGYGGGRNILCKSVNDYFHVKRRGTDEMFNILKGPLDCNSNHVIYLFECKQCCYRFPYVGGAKAKVRYRINN